MTADPYIPTTHVSLFAHDLLELLRVEAVGKENAKKIRHYEFVFSVDRREVEKATEELRGAGIPLCSSVCAPYGLFLARDFREAEAWVRQVEHRMKVMAIHKNLAIQSVRRIAERDGVQLEMGVMV